MILINFFLFSSKRTKWWIIHGVKRGRDLLSVSTHTWNPSSHMSQGISEMFTYNHRKPLIFILRKSFFFRNFRPHYLNTFVDFSLEILLTPLKQMRTELFSRVIKYVLLTKKKKTFLNAILLSSTTCRKIFHYISSN